MSIFGRTWASVVVLGLGAGLLMMGLYPAGPPPNALYWFVPALATLIVGVAAGSVIVSRNPNIGPVARFGDSRAFRAVRSVAGVSMTSCGCVHLGDHETRPTVEVLDNERVWLREIDGAKVKYTDGARQHVRCERCGNRYHRTRQNPRSSVKHEFWDDAPEPWPDDDREVVEAARR